MKSTDNKDQILNFKKIIRNEGVKGWKAWRKTANYRKEIDLSGMHLSGMDLHNIDLSGVNLANAKINDTILTQARLWGTRFDGATIKNCNFDMAELSYSSFTKSILKNNRFVWSNLSLANFSDADMRTTNLSYSNLSGVNFEGADFSGSIVTGTNTWGLLTNQNTIQKGLKIEPWDEPLFMVSEYGLKPEDRVILQIDNIEVGHLLYLFTELNKKQQSEKIKGIIDALTGKMVLLLGNFGLRRKRILKNLRLKLAEEGYVPVIFDFKPPADRDLIESVAIFAGLSKFVIADFTAASSTPLEAMLIISGFKVPFAPIILKKNKIFSMFHSLRAKYDWVMEPWYYSNNNQLLRSLKTKVIIPCERMRNKIAKRRQKIDINLLKSKIGIK